MNFLKISELQVLLLADRDHLMTVLENCECEISEAGPTKELLDSLLNLILTAKFQDIFKHDEVHNILPSVLMEERWHASLRESIQCYLDVCVSSEEKQNRKVVVLFIGVAALQFFVQQNWTGPLVTEYSSSIFPCREKLSSCIDSLAFCNQQVYRLIKYPEFLLLARTILYDINNETETSSWWKLRYLSVHQAVLEDKNSEIYFQIISGINEAKESAVCKIKNVSAHLKIESALLCLRFHDITKAKTYLKAVQEDSGFTVNLVGALGTRTHFQTIPHAQLYLQVEKTKDHSPSLYPMNSEISLNVKLQDDTLLNTIKFLEITPKLPELNVEDMSTILALSVLHQKENARDELLEEELNAYTDYILSSPSNFCIQFCALLLRSSIEKQKSRKVERAMMQLQALLDQTRKDTENSSLRLQLFYSTPMPPTWDVEKILAQILLSLGSVKSALDIFLRLEMWEECVLCYKSLQRNDKALKIIEDQLQKGQTPLLLCLKGDVTDDPSCYEKAWELSKCHSARAKRSLGFYHFQKKEYKESIPHLLKSVEIDSLEQRAWFYLGHAATQIEDYELAAKCYRSLINLNSESFEAWNNLSNAYIRLNDKHRAWRTLQEALKCNYEEWKVWENYLLVSIDVGAFDEAINAWHRLIDLKGKHVDDDVICILENAIINNLNDINDQPASRLLEKSLKLLGHITSTDTSSFKTWTSYANLLEYKATEHEDPTLLDRVIQYRHKALSIIKNETQKKLFNKSLVQELLDCACALSKVYLKRYQPVSEGQSKQQLYAAKLMIVNTLAFAKQKTEHFSDAELNSELIQSRLQELEYNLDIILKLIA